MDYLGIFITGLTTGGISCLAMHGGLLASTVANQKDEELGESTKATSSKKKIKQLTNTSAGSFDQLDWLPVSVFIVGKLVSHTLAGFLLGWLGSTMELSVGVRLTFQVMAGIFMFATAMNLLQVHPIFRYVVIQPPRFVLKLLKSSTKGQAVFTPFVVGFLTILIPCGVTQSMQLLAISSGNPIIGALIMFFFVLGTSPIFGAIGVGIAKFSEFWKGAFLRAAAVMLIFLSAQAINGALVVWDAPITWQKVTRAVLDPAGLSTDPADLPPVVDGVQRIDLRVLNHGYEPRTLRVKAGIPVEMILTTDNTYSCAVDFMIPAFGIREFLDPTGERAVGFTPDKPGRYTFACSMGMYTGVLEVI